MINVLATKLELAVDDADRRQHPDSASAAIHEQLEHFDLAVQAYDAVLQMGVEDPAALAALDRLYVRLEKWTELADILRRELAVVEEQGEESEAGMKLPDRATLRYRLGVILQEHLGDAAEAVELFRQVLEYDPEHEDARRRLESWLDDADLKVRVATILRDVYQRREDWAQLVRVLEILAEAEDVTRIAWCCCFASARSRRRRWATAGLRSTPTRVRSGRTPRTRPLSRRCSSIAGIDERWADLAELYEGAVAKDLPSELMKQLLHKLAAVYDAQLGNAAQAINCYKRAVDIDPENREALDALEELYQRGSAWAELLGVYRSKVEFEDDPDLRQGSALQDRLPAGGDAPAEPRGDRDLQRDPRGRRHQHEGDRRARSPLPGPGQLGRSRRDPRSSARARRRPRRHDQAEPAARRSAPDQARAGRARRRDLSPGVRLRPRQRRRARGSRDAAQQRGAAADGGQDPRADLPLDQRVVAS